MDIMNIACIINVKPENCSFNSKTMHVLLIKTVYIKKLSKVFLLCRWIEFILVLQM